ncbi:hypothetical protein NDU88_000493 [Pleurodeles waltl]|uniref:Uncharacterized protein n=1 Tax=Pleurodeles waltl TaxID=8319 RepID=A0AAV7M0D5_PLEWA|nr:hypothetical protein NDU88_000493 [Pleurodeles waltl]
MRRCHAVPAGAMHSLCALMEAPLRKKVPGRCHALSLRSEAGTFTPTPIRGLCSIGQREPMVGRSYQFEMLPRPERGPTRVRVSWKVLMSWPRQLLHKGSR